MFHKPFKVKQTFPLKPSEKKKLKQTLDKNFIDQPIKFDKNNKLSQQKIFTSSNVPFELFLENDEPVLLESRSKSLIPTVPLVLKSPWLIKSTNVVNIPHHVFEQLQNGSDLMASELVDQENEFVANDFTQLKNLNKKDIIGIRSITETGVVNPILAIGRVIMTQAEIQQSELKSGKFAEIITIIGDELWNCAVLKNLPSDVEQAW